MVVPGVNTKRIASVWSCACVTRAMGIVVASLLATAHGSTAVQAAEGGSDVPVTIRVRAEEINAKPVSPLIYGNFIEMGFGRQVEGLWSEMLFNRSFEPIPPYSATHWYWLHRGPDDDLTKEDWWHSGYEEQPWFLVPGNAKAEWKTVDAAGFRRGQWSGWLVNRSADTWAAVAQNGIFLRKGERYRFSGYLRAPGEMWDLGPNDEALSVELRMYREGDWSSPLAVRTLPSVGGVFEGETVCEFEVPDFEGRACLSLWIPPNALLNMDDLSLMPQSNMGGWRRDAVEAARRVKAPILRWPGGCFASFYHWRSGIGPRQERHPEPSVFWGGLHDNDVGTAEYVAFCRLVNAEPFFCVNLLTGTADEAADWVAYCNAPVEHPLGALRFRHGHPEPMRVRYWELDNEAFRCFGPIEYAERCVLFSKAMKAVDPSIKTVMIGYGNYAPHLARMLEIAGPYIDFVTDRAIDEPSLQAALATIQTYNASSGTDLRLCNTEWLAQMTDVPVKADAFNVQPLPADDTMQNRQIRWKYGLNTARQLLLFQRLGGDFAFANFNNFANTWGQNVIECPKEGAYLSGVGRVFELMVSSPAAWILAIDPHPLPEGLTAQVAWDESRNRLVVCLVNDQAKAFEVVLNLSALGKTFSSRKTTVLSADSITAFNTLTHPDRIRRTELEVVGEDVLRFEVPPCALVQAVLFNVP